MKNLLKYFHALTIHPKNAAELKGLILQLAVQGKLTVNWRLQNPDVEPASVLLERIKSFNKRELEKKNRRVSKPKNEKKELVNLPHKWISVQNYELFTLQKGKNPKDLSETIKKYPYQDIEALDRGNVRRYSNDEKAPRCSSGDLLVVCDGSRSGLVLNGQDGIVGSTLAIIESPPFIQDYIRIIFLQDYERANSNMKGAAIPHLDTAFLLAETIGLPPLEEQKAIVSVVNQLFAEVEQLEALTKERIRLKEDFVSSALQQLINSETINGEWAFLQQHFATFFTELPNIKKLRESILQLAVQGKLTTHWRKENPELVSGSHSAKALLERIKTEKAQLVKAGKIKKEKPLPRIASDEIPYELPEGWVWCRLGETIRFMAYGTSQKTDDNYNNIPVLRMGNITTDGYLLKDTNLKYISPSCKDLPKLYLDNLDIVFNRTNSYELVGKSAVYKGANEEYTLASYLIKVSLFYEYVNTDYINNYIISRVCRETQIEPQITAQTNQANFSGSKLREVIVPLPPLPEQKAIVEKVNALMALCDQLEQEIRTSQSTRENWMKSSLREVFSEAKPKAETKAKVLDGGELGMVAELESKYNN